ncbi:PP2C family protein-serine/threonine phosphatase [Streptomyces sp. NPDC098077]|uniref:PP2C family protein-serine/threonine phosphatase n=1 Tax=Streptomyces sp. NPDC098077 TaxID=3366093 RepID=UPI00382AEECA
MKRLHLPRSSYIDPTSVGVLIAVALADALLGPAVTLTALFAAAPGLALSRGARAGAVIGTGLAAAVMATELAHHDSTAHSAGELWPVLAICLTTVLSAVAARARNRQGHRLTQAVNVAEAAQRTIIDAVPDVPGPVNVAASYESATAGSGIGGDFYDVVPIRDGVRLIIGDVQGKGLAAVPAAATVLAAFRESAPVAPSLEAVGRKMSCALVRRPEDRFVTAAVAELTQDGHLSVLNYGHPEPLILHTDGSIDSADPDQPGMPLGLDALARSRPGRYRETLTTGDRILFHTDGLSEARDPSGTFYPVGARAGLLRNTGLSTGLSRLRHDMKQHATKTAPEDDSALLLLEYTGAFNPAPSTRRHTSELPIAVDTECRTCAITNCPISAAHYPAPRALPPTPNP